MEMYFPFIFIYFFCIIFSVFILENIYEDNKFGFCFYFCWFGKIFYVCMENV